MYRLNWSSENSALGVLLTEHLQQYSPLRLVHVRTASASRLFHARAFCISKSPVSQVSE